MIYLDEFGRPPMSGVRVGHEMVTENVIEIKIQYAAQSFRSARRELTLLDLIGDDDPSDEALQEFRDHATNLPGRRPLVSGGGGDR